MLIKSGDIQWEEVENEKEPDNAINYILDQRRKFGWNLKLPVNGAQARYGMDTYQDRVDSDLKKTLEDDGRFQYAMCISDVKENILYSPYEIRTTTGEIAKRYPVYYTVSASYVTKIYNPEFNADPGEQSIQPVMRWLWEKRLFDKLRSIRVFYLFRKRRTFKCWLVHIRKTKQVRVRAFLHRRLFTGNEVFQSVLLHVKMLTERASGSRDGHGVGEHAITMIKLDTTEIYELEDFQRMQSVQIEQALERLMLLKEEIIKLTYVSCVTVGELEGIDFDAFFDCDNFTHQQAVVDNYLENRQTRTSRLRDMNSEFPLPQRKGWIQFDFIVEIKT